MSIDDLVSAPIEQRLAGMSMYELRRLRDLAINEMMLRYREPREPECIEAEEGPAFVMRTVVHLTPRRP